MTIGTRVKLGSIPEKAEASHFTTFNGTLGEDRLKLEGRPGDSMANVIAVVRPLWN